MREYLMFRLYGPMASWGDIAVGEYRPSFAHPSKSAVMGMLAAAVGLRREEEDKQRQFTGSYGFAVQVHAAGTLLRDYHTIQVPPKQRGVKHATRRSELLAPKLNTILSSRDYRCDAFYTIAIWDFVEHPPYSLAELVLSLACPVFTLYLGRKSCPPALPMQARTIRAENLKQAFLNVNFFDKGIPPSLPESGHIATYWEGSDSGFKSEHIIIRRDNSTSRRRWQFADREEQYAGVAPGKEG